MEYSYTGTSNLLRLLKIEGVLSSDLRNAINKKATAFLNDLTFDVAQFLCGEEIHEEEHNEEDIRTLVQCVPNSLRYSDYYGDLPLAHALHRGNLSFIPMLAEEGMKLETLNTDDLRGGLLCGKGSDFPCVLESISFGGNHDSWDLRCLNVIKSLRARGLLKKQDVKDHALLWYPSSLRYSVQRFNYFVDWDPAALRDKDSEMGYALLHSLAFRNNITGFELALKATFRHYPKELGLLLLKDSEGGTAFQLSRLMFGKQKSWMLIKNLLDEINSCNILEKDLETNIYPFMFAAAGDSSELDLVYYLVRRNPHCLQHRNVIQTTNNHHGSYDANPRIAIENHLELSPI